MALWRTYYLKLKTNPLTTYWPRSLRVEKYRPVTLDDLVSHKDITSTSTFITSHAYLQRVFPTFE